jgi:predicted kinase
VVATLIHLNGAPGVGKSTIASRYVADHPGVLNCDVDRLRCFIGGWADDFGAVGAVVRPLALAMIGAHLDGGRDVLLPQMLADETERARFRAAAVESGHRYVHVLLQSRPGEARTRFYRRCEDDPLHAVIRGVVDGEGGGSVIDELDRRLAHAAASTQTVGVDASGDVESTYRAVLRAVGAGEHPG